MSDCVPTLLTLNFDPNQTKRKHWSCGQSKLNDYSSLHEVHDPIGNVVIDHQKQDQNHCDTFSHRCIMQWIESTTIIRMLFDCLFLVNCLFIWLFVWLIFCLFVCLVDCLFSRELSLTSRHISLVNIYVTLRV